MIEPRPFLGTTVSVSQLDALRRLALSCRPRESPDLLLDWSPNGFLYRLRRRPTWPEDLQMALATAQGYGDDAAKVEVAAGFVEHHHGASGTTYHAVATAKLTLAEGWNMIYVDYTIGTSAAAAVLTATGSPTTWAEALAELQSTATHLKVPLAGWTLSAAGLITRGPTWHQGNIRIAPVQAT